LPSRLAAGNWAEADEPLLRRRPSPEHPPTSGPPQIEP
jgi:hypothetical protein